MKLRKILSFGSIIFFSLTSFAAPQTIPGSVDAGRIITEEQINFPKETPDRQILIPKTTSSVPAPDGAKTIHFILKEVKIEGMKAFTTQEILSSYASYLNKEVSLTTAWTIAEAITQRYKAAGYFLSRAHVPEQSIKNGKIILKVVEGYISKIEIPASIKESFIVQSYITKLLSKRPTTALALEEFLLRLNDLPGYSFRSVISPIKDKNEAEGQAQLTLIPSNKKANAMVSIDNFSSRYLGPSEVSGSYSTSLLPLQQTTLSGIVSLPLNKLSYGAFNHSIMIAPNTNLNLNISTTKIYPEYTLKYLDISSSANSFSLGVNYQWIRQRQENLSTNFMLYSINVTSDILNAPLVRDHVRALQTGFTYNLSDKWQGYNIVDFALSKGISGIGANKINDPYLSRAGAKPNFTKAKLSLSRLQEITDSWSLFASSTGQAASGTLYSTELFGYGGQSFGKAYDLSEITGDQGVNAALELRYSGIKTPEAITLQPYGFYDIGYIKNFSSSQPNHQSGASAGLGLRFLTKWKQTGNFGVAWPLTRKISTPIYGGNTRAPRVMLQISQEF